MSGLLSHIWNHHTEIESMSNKYRYTLPKKAFRVTTKEDVAKMTSCFLGKRLHFLFLLLSGTRAVFIAPSRDQA